MKVLFKFDNVLVRANYKSTIGYLTISNKIDIYSLDTLKEYINFDNDCSIIIEDKNENSDTNKTCRIKNLRTSTSFFKYISLVNHYV